jgi:hypothetical protein
MIEDWPMLVKMRNSLCGIPVGAIIEIDETRRDLVEGAIFALRDRDTGECFITQVAHLSPTPSAEPDPDWEVIGKVVGWQESSPTRH